MRLTVADALSHYNYWFLAVRSDVTCERGDVSAVKGLRLSASADPGLTLKRCWRKRASSTACGMRP